MVPTIFETFRESMSVTRNWCYFDHAAVGPLPDAAVTALTQYAADFSTSGDVHWPRWRNRVEQIRTRLAHGLGAHQDEIAFVANTTSAINLIAQTFPFRPGDNVVTLDNEFPSNLYPWQCLEPAGVELRRVGTSRGRVDLQRIADACDARTRLLTVSWVGFASGWRLDVPEVAKLAHDHGALLFLDAIQGLGVFPLNVETAGVDFLAADGHKWMLGPEGAGMLYIRKEHLHQLRLQSLGWNSAAVPFSFEPQTRWKDAAERYEGGSHNLAGLIAWGASLDLLASMGWSADRNPLADRVLELSDYAANRICERGGELLFDRDEPHRSGIVTFHWPGETPTELRKRCLDAGIVLSIRGGGLRVSPHAYNQLDELDRLFEVLP